MPTRSEHALVAVAGPTGSGKSELALAIAEAFSGEVVNCDSIQIYRHFDIGAAKLPPPARRGIPHHLLDIAEPDEIFSAGEYIRRARPILADIARRGRLPVVAGGTGFYLRALLDGLSPGPTRDETLRSRLAARERARPGCLHRLLTRLDPDSARRIHPRDIRRTTRALEIRLLARRPAAELFASAGVEPLPDFRTLKVGLNPPRAALFERIDRRCLRMVESGLIDEVRHILELGFPPDVKPFESVGYRQALQAVQGTLTHQEVVYYAQRDTRQYAKRQMTWFRKEKDLEWFSGFGDEEATQSRVLARVREFLGL